MRCCVSECKNDSRHLSKTQGITFHAFPTEGAVRSIWLEALGKKNWKPKDRSAVCSDHFTAADFYVTKNGLRKVRAGAIPTLSQLDVCRVCLVMDTKLFSMKSFKLDETYKQLTNLTLPKADCLPHMLCPECAQRLHNYSVLRNRALQAHQILTDIVQSQCHLTLESIKAIDRVSAKLTSSLTAKHIKPDHYDLNTEYTQTQPVTEEEKKTYEPIQQVNIHSEINIEYDVKEEQDFDDENQINHEEDHIDDEKSHIVDEKSVKDDAKCDMNDGKGDEIETNASNIHEEEDNGDTNDDDYTVFANDDDDTSSDSIPIKHLQTVKRKKASPAKQKKVKKKAVKPIPTEPKIDRRRKPLLNDYLNETLFTVLNLTREEQLAEIVKRKESTNYKNAVYRCGECFKGFLEVEAYNTHMIRHTDQWGTHECDICKTRFKHPHALRKHITAHHTQRFSCNHCPYVTTHRQTARLHERWHKGIKYQCPHCPEEFVKFTTYMGHVRIKHPSDFICELCGYSFVSAKGIELHKKLKHRLDDVQIPDDAPSCELCNVRFISSEALSRHLLRSARHASDDKDPKEKTRKPRKQREARPPANSKRDREETDNSDHEPRRGLYPSQMRKAEGPIPCEQCGIQLEDSRAYHSHFRRSHPDKNRTNYPSMKSPCMCEVCGRMFQSYALLRDHRWLHTGEKPFKCELCSKSFRMKQRLVAHRRVHSAQRATYVCAHCGKHFSTHSNRQRHMFIHTGLKPFKCEMCGKCFKHSSEKRAHITYVHLKKPWPKRARHKRGSQMDMEPQREVENQMWPAACEDKIVDMEVMDDKQGYYHLKI